MSDESKKPGAAIWMSVVLLMVLVLYPLSLGPACWITSRLNFGAQAIPVIYRPITLLLSREDESIGRSLFIAYAGLGAPPGWGWYLIADNPDPSDNETRWWWGQITF